MNLFAKFLGAGLCLTATLCLMGCPSAHERKLLDAAAALEACDVRAANTAFEAAYDMDRNDATSALGYGLSEFALLAEDPAVTVALIDLGFERGLDMDVLLFGEDAALARAARSDDCNSIRSHLEANFPHPAVGGGEPSDYFRAGLTATDLVDDLTPLLPTLAKVSQALETGATAMAAPITFDGGCGVGTVTLQAPELFFAAAIVEAVRAALVMAPAYDWDIEMKTLMLGSPHELADALNTHVLQLRDANTLTAAKPSLVRALGLARRGVGAANAITSPVANGLFDWSQLDDMFSRDALVLLQFATDTLEGPARLPFVTPALEVNASLFFSAPVDARALSGPIWTVTETEFGASMDVNDEILIEMLRPAIPAVDSDAEYRSAWDDRWRDLSFRGVLAPLTRYEAVYRCASSTRPITPGM